MIASYAWYTHMRVSISEAKIDHHFGGHKISQFGNEYLLVLYSSLPTLNHCTSLMISTEF
jgi:hypothetical protein